MFYILKDIYTGALPASEIPGFLAWAFRKFAWLCFWLIAGFVVGFLIAR